MQCLSLFFFPLMSHLGVHIVAQKAYLFFLKPHYISFFGGTIHGFNQDYVDGYFGCFHFFVITSCAAMGKLIRVTFLACAGIPGGRSLKNGIIGYFVNVADTNWPTHDSY